MRVLHLASDLGPNAPAKQLSLIAPALAAAYPLTQRVFCWGRASPFEPSLISAGIPVHRVGFEHRYHLPGWLELRRQIRDFAPDLVHLWGRDVCRWWPIIEQKFLGANLSRLPVVANYQRDDADFPSILSRRTIRQVDHLFVSHEHTAATVVSMGVAADRVSVVPMSVGAPLSPTKSREELRAKYGLPADAIVILHASNLDTRGEARRAIWSFDLLKHTSPRWRFVLVGTGPNEQRVKTFNAKLAYDDQRVTFLPYQPRLWELYPMVDVMWLTHDRGGENLALEAMAHGVPVFAFWNADLGELITNLGNGFLVPRSAPPQLGVETNDLRLDPRIAERLSQSARETAASRAPAIGAASYWQIYSQFRASQADAIRSQ